MDAAILSRQYLIGSARRRQPPKIISGAGRNLHWIRFTKEVVLALVKMHCEMPDQLGESWVSPFPYSSPVSDRYGSYLLVWAIFFLASRPAARVDGQSMDVDAQPQTKAGGPAGDGLLEQEGRMRMRTSQLIVKSICTGSNTSSSHISAYWS